MLRQARSKAHRTTSGHLYFALTYDCIDLPQRATS
jgi:hypothetical protein